MDILNLFSDPFYDLAFDPLLLGPDVSPGATKPTHRQRGGRRRRAHHRDLIPSGASDWSGGPQSVPMDVVETGTAFRLTADTPGMDPGDIKLELHEGVLTLSGHRRAAHQGKGFHGKVWSRERGTINFHRSFTLPDTASTEGISASMDQGVLTVTVPKKEPEPKPEPKRIAVSEM